MLNTKHLDSLPAGIYTGKGETVKYAVYAENLDGERRFLDHCTSDNVGRGIFDLYADECGDEEEIVVVPVTSRGPRG